MDSKRQQTVIAGGFGVGLDLILRFWRFSTSAKLKRLLLSALEILVKSVRINALLHEQKLVGSKLSAIVEIGTRGGLSNILNLT